MSQLNFECKNQVLLMSCPDRLIVADSKKQVYANFTLDDEWNGLTVVAIFSNAWETIRKEVLLTEMCVEIPTSVLTDPGFRVSLNGIGDGGNVLLSTKYMTKPISVHRAGSLVCLQAPDADPELWQQALAAIGPLSNLDTEDKSSLVAAINETLKSGGGTITTDAIASALGYIPMGPNMVQDEIKNATNNLVRLPGDSLKPEYGTRGQIATSDGKGGLAWKDYAAASDFYTVDRDNIGVPVDERDVAEFYELYDELVDNKFVTKRTLEIVGGLEIREYVFSTGEYNTEGKRGVLDQDIKKPKYLILSGIHGGEKWGIMSTYLLFRDIVKGTNIPSHFRDGISVHVIPIGNPYAANLKGSQNGRLNENGVDINRNFAYKWEAKDYHGSAPESETETRTIADWLRANTDAKLFVDMHNSTFVGTGDDKESVTNEVAAIIGLDSEIVKTAKQIGMRGLDRVIPFWRDVRKFTEHDSGKPVFSYSSVEDVPGGSAYYAAGKLNIPSFFLECSAVQNGKTTDFKFDTMMQPETIATGAEALGNILLEFYEQVGDQNHGNEGQFAVSDGKGGVTWKDITNQETLIAMAVAAMSASAQYGSIEDALNGTNPVSGGGAVSKYTDNAGVTHIVLLTDIKKSGNIEVTKGCTLHLNGHTIEFTTAPARLNIATSEDVVIDGTIAGSMIKKDLTSALTNNSNLVVVSGAYLTINGGEYIATASGGGSSQLAGINVALNEPRGLALNDCTITLNGNTSGNVKAVASIAKENILRDCKINVVCTASEVVTAEKVATCAQFYNDVTVENCKMTVRTKAKKQGSIAIQLLDDITKVGTTDVIVNNCKLHADGAGDVDGASYLASCISTIGNVNLTVNGGYYTAAKEALHTTNEASVRINGGIFEGSQHGGAYLGGDVKVKKATFRNVSYTGDCGWNATNLGACYCGSAAGASNIYFYRCKFEYVPKLSDAAIESYGIVANYDGTNVYISDSTISGNNTVAMRADSSTNDFIYVGANVDYSPNRCDGNVDFNTMKEQNFAW